MIRPQGCEQGTREMETKRECKRHQKIRARAKWEQRKSKIASAKEIELVICQTEQNANRKRVTATHREVRKNSSGHTICKLEMDRLRTLGRTTPSQPSTEIYWRNQNRHNSGKHYFKMDSGSEYSFAFPMTGAKRKDTDLSIQNCDQNYKFQRKLKPRIKNKAPQDQRRTSTQTRSGTAQAPGMTPPGTAVGWVPQGIRSCINWLCVQKVSNKSIQIGNKGKVRGKRKEGDTGTVSGRR